MFWETALAASLLVARAHAGIGALVAEGAMAGRSVALVERMAAIAESYVEEAVPGVVKRANATTANNSTATAGAGVVLNSDGTINMTAWDSTTNAACVTALDKLSASTNPSGTCVCYNLPALNNSTGAFEADLRLYQLSTPSGDFTGIAASDIQVGLSYTSASVSPVNSSTLSTRQTVNMDVTSTSGLQLLQTYLFVGQINTEKLTSSVTMAQLQAMVMPTVTLSGVNSSGATASTNVSMNEAAFVAGIFSDEVVMSTTALAQQAVDLVTAELANGTVAFVVPGVQLLLFPIGLIITSVWIVVGLAFIGFGTYERMNYREQFNRRMAMEGKPLPNRI